MSLACGSKTSLNLSLLSRGIGEVKKNGHERIDVFLEPQDYFNFIGGGGTDRRRAGHLPILPSSSRAGPAALTLGSSDETSGPSNANLPKTFTTRKGALLLFSEDLAEKMRWTSKTRRRRRMKRKALPSNRPTETSEDVDTLDLDTIEDLTNAILTYGNEESRIYLKFIKSQRTPRPFRPGFSAKRYLSRLTRDFDEGFLDVLMSKGFVSEATLFTSNSLLPHLRRRIDDDLSHAPAPYRILRQVVTGPGIFSGFSFCSDGPEATFTLDELGTGEKDGELLHVLQVKNGVQTPVDYERLSHREKENALADILVKSAIEHVLKVHKGNVTLPDVKEDTNENLELTGGSVRMSAKPWNQVNMTEAVRTYLRGPQTNRQTFPNAINRTQPQISGDWQSISDDLYASDPSTTGDSLSFSSSRRSSIIGLPVGRGQSSDRQNKMPTHPVHVMSPIIDSRMVSREVTLNAVPVLPPIGAKIAHQDRAALPKSDVKLYEKMVRDEDQKMSQMLSDVLKVGGFIQNVYAYDANRTSGPSSVQSLGSFKGGSTQRHKKNIHQKPDIRKATDGSSVVMTTPGGQFIQVGHSISFADNDQKKKQAFDGRSAFPTDAVLIRRLAEGARNLASLVLSNPDTGQDLKNDAMRAAELWMASRLELPEGRPQDIPDQQAAMRSVEESLQSSTASIRESNDQSVVEYKRLIAGTLLNVVSRLSGKDVAASPTEARISPQLMQSLLTRTVDPSEVTVVDDASGGTVITVRHASTDNGKKTKTKGVGRSSTRHSNEFETLNGFSAADVGKNVSSVVTARDAATELNYAAEIDDSTKTNKKHRADSPGKLTDTQRQMESVEKSNGKTATSSETHLLAGTEATKRRRVTKGFEETNEETTKRQESFVPATSKKAASKRKKKKKQGKGETEDEAPSEQPEVSLESTRKEDPRKKETSKKKNVEQGSMEDEELVFASETWSDGEAEELFSPQSGISAKSQTDDDANQPSYLSDASTSSKTELNKQNRAAQREAKAEQRRQEVQRKRREREEQLRMEKEEAERMERMARELEEERRRKEEATRLEKERLEEARRRREEELLARERMAEMEAERERRIKEEYMRKLEELKQKQAEEARLRAELEEKRRLEEAERQRLERLMLAKMAAEERERYLRTKKDEEEKLRKLEEAEKRRRLEEQKRAAEEAMRLAQEMARKQIELQRRLEFNRSLHSESNNLTQSQSVTRAFVFSYLELLKWLSLDPTTSDNAQPKYADLQRSQ